MAHPAECREFTAIRERFEKEFDEKDAPKGWKRVNADEWADFTSDYICYHTERAVNGRDTMLSRCDVMGSTIDIAMVQYIYTGYGMLKIYAINEGARELIKYRLRDPVQRNKMEAA
jgi:hypothetical protein